MALRDTAEGRIVANLDIRRRTGGWQIYELRTGQLARNSSDASRIRTVRWLGVQPGTYRPRLLQDPASLSWRVPRRTGSGCRS